MADSARQRKTYRTSGSVAYQDQYDDSAVRNPRRAPAVQPEPEKRPKVHPRERIRKRPHVEVRQAGAVAPFSVIGFMVVALCATLLVVSYARLAVLSDQAVQLKNELKTLQTNEAALTAQYELAYDLATIERQLTSNGSMVKLQPSQVTYLDISAPDSVIVYGSDNRGIGSFVQEISDFFTQLLTS